jgi:homoserine O-acetyltransferase
VLANPELLAPRRSLAVDQPLQLQSGQRLPAYRLGFETYGTLAPRADNAILVCHSLTKDAHAAGRYSLADERRGWWDAAIGPGRMLDTDRHFVICADALGSGESTGPASTDPATGRAYGLGFPVLTVTDMVRAAQPLLEHLGIERLHAVIGGCLGGQQAIEWAIRYPRSVRNVVAISTTSATSAHTIAIFHVMRRLIRADPKFNDGAYYDGPFPQEGMTNALAAAVPLWMSREAAEARFGRRRNGHAAYAYSLDGEFAIEAFLERVAGRGASRLDPNSLMYLMRAVEYFDLAHQHGGLDQALAPIRARVLLVSYRNDWRYPPAEVRGLDESLRAAGVDCRHVALASAYGHGAFMYDVGTLAPVVERFLDEHERPRNPRATPLTTTV